MLITNMSNFTAAQGTLEPLISNEGTKSNHWIIAVPCNLPWSHHFTKTTFMARSMTESGLGKFRELILRENWATVFFSEKSLTGAVITLNKTLLLMLDTALPKKKYTRKSTDAPWLSECVRRLTRRRKKIFKKIIEI